MGDNKYHDASHYNKSIKNKILTLDDLEDFKYILNSIDSKLISNSNIEYIEFERKYITFKIPPPIIIKTYKYEDFKPTKVPMAKPEFRLDLTESKWKNLTFNNTIPPGAKTLKTEYYKIKTIPNEISKLINRKFDNKLNFVNNILWEFLLATPKFEKHLRYLSKELQNIRKLEYNHETYDLEQTIEEELELLNGYYKNKYNHKSFTDIRNKILLKYGVDLFDYNKIWSDKFNLYYTKKSGDSSESIESGVIVNRKFNMKGKDWFYNRNNQEVILSYCSSLYKKHRNLDVKAPYYTINTEYPLHQLLKRSVFIEINPFVTYEKLEPNIKCVYDEISNDLSNDPIITMLENIELNKTQTKRDISSIKKYKRFKKDLTKRDQNRKFSHALLIYKIMQIFNIKKMTVATRYANYYILKLSINKKICINDHEEKITLKEALKLNQIYIDTDIFISEEGKYQKELKRVINIFKEILNL